MAELIDTVRDLLSLNRIDLIRYELQTEIEQTPRRLAAQKEELGQREEARDRQAAALSAAQTALKEGEELLTKTERRRDRAEQRIPMLKTAEQVDATQREIAALRQDIDDLEGEILERMDRVERLEESARAATDGVEEMTTSLAADRTAWEARSPVAKSEMTALDAEREPLKGGLHTDYLRRYQLAWRQRGKMQPTGVTAVVGRICETCHTEVSARWLQESRDYVALHSCQSCKRLLLFDPDCPPPTVEADASDTGEQPSSP